MNIEDTLAQVQALRSQGQLADAERLCQQLLSVDAHNLRGLKHLGQLRLQAGDSQVAFKHLSRALELGADDAATHASLAMCHSQLQQFQAALHHYERAIALAPERFELSLNRGNLYLRHGQFDLALADYERASTGLPNLADGHFYRAKTLHMLQRYEDALASYQRTIELRPNMFDAHLELGHCFMALGRASDAINAFRTALTLCRSPASQAESANQAWRGPEAAKALFYCGAAHQSLQKLQPAIDCYQMAIAADPRRQDAHLNLGGLLRDHGQAAGAMKHYDAAFQLDPNSFALHNNRCSLQIELGQFEAAQQSIQHMLRLKQNSSDALSMQATIHLLQGDLLRGFELYEHRWTTLKPSSPPRQYQQALWLGQFPIAGRRILVHAEQGLGDTLQICRYLKLLKDLGAYVIFQVQTPLAPLMRMIEGPDLVLTNRDQVPNFDCHCPLLSLPLALKTDLSNIPKAIPYLQIDEQRVAAWAPHFAKTDFNIGIAWQGNPFHRIDIGRSFHVQHFAPIAALPGVKLYSLQRNHGSEQLKSIESQFEVKEFGADFDTEAAFFDSAAVIKNLDLVISADTAIAHLAGGLGCEVWVALKLVPDWRHMLHCEYSPWYPQMRLFRQKKYWSWDSVFEEMKQALELKLGQSK